ncbi:MAG: hypothetical protein ACOY94_05760 [Bacillota bacterium]
MAFSRSGETTETLVALRRHLAERIGPAMAISCRERCSPTDEADLSLNLPAADDQSVVMTSSFTTMLLASLRLSAGLARLPGLLEGLIAKQRLWGESVGSNPDLDHFVLLGLGPVYGL